jgi:hypothetical protein
MDLGSELVEDKTLTKREGQVGTESFYRRTDHQDASGDRSSSVLGQDHHAYVLRAWDHGADLLLMKERVWRSEDVPGSAFQVLRTGECSIEVGGCRLDSGQTYSETGAEGNY